MTARNRKWSAFALAVSLYMMATPAFAYLDPSTGSMIISAIVGLFATAALAVKTYWYKLKSLFRSDTPESSAAADDSASGQPAETEPSADR
jgi:hypothetical protein